MSKYDPIDGIINNWVLKNGLHLFTTCKDEEVRIVRMTDDQGRIYGIGVDIPNGDQVTVRFYAWDFKKRNKSVAVKVKSLSAALEDVLKQIRAWMDV